MSADDDDLEVTYIPGACRSDWMAGMELDWPHRALLLWSGEGDGGDGVDLRMRRVLWSALTEGDSIVGVPEQISAGSATMLGRLFKGRPKFTMKWTDDFTDFNTLFDHSLYFAASFDPSALRPDHDTLAFWHDQALPPADSGELFPDGQRIVIRSGADEMCFGVFAKDMATLSAFRETLEKDVRAVSGSFADSREPHTS